MTSHIIDGKAFAAKLRAEIATEVAQIKGQKPGLAVVLVGSDPASEIYVSSKGKMTREVGMESFEYKLPENTTQGELLSLIERLNNDSAVNGILVQLPLPKHLNETEVVNTILPQKDVDGLNVINAGKLALGDDSGLVPCTPLGSLMLIKDQCADLSGKHAVVLGRSILVGKPVAALLLQENCTVTIAHSRTQNLAELCRTADILVAAVGRPEMVKGEWIKEGAIVMDVGINRLPPETNAEKGRIVGDVDFAEAAKRASAITPVPGGVGPMTIACLLHNTLRAFRLQKASR